MDKTTRHDITQVGFEKLDETVQKLLAAKHNFSNGDNIHLLSTGVLKELIDDILLCDHRSDVIWMLGQFNQIN